MGNGAVETQETTTLKPLFRAILAGVTLGFIILEYVVGLALSKQKRKCNLGLLYGSGLSTEMVEAAHRYFGN